MRRFAALFRCLDRSTATLDKRAALVAYFRDVPREDAARAPWLLAGGKIGAQVADTCELRDWIAKTGVRRACLRRAGTGLHGAGVTAVFCLIARIGAPWTMTMSFPIPLFGVSRGWPFLHETVSAEKLAGCSLILADAALGTGLSNAHARRRAFLESELFPQEAA